jgi:long-chain acyl-CoA synthetase
MSQLDFSKLAYEKFKVNLNKQMHAVPGTGKPGESGSI